MKGSNALFNYCDSKFRATRVAMCTVRLEAAQVLELLALLCRLHCLRQHAFRTTRVVRIIGTRL